MVDAQAAKLALVHKVTYLEQEVTVLLGQTAELQAAPGRACCMGWCLRRAAKSGGGGCTQPAVPVLSNGEDGYAMHCALHALPSCFTAYAAHQALHFCSSGCRMPGWNHKRPLCAGRRPSWKVGQLPAGSDSQIYERLLYFFVHRPERAGRSCRGEGWAPGSSAIVPALTRTQGPRNVLFPLSRLPLNLLRRLPRLCMLAGRRAEWEHAWAYQQRWLCLASGGGFRWAGCFPSARGSYCRARMQRALWAWGTAHVHILAGAWQIGPSHFVVREGVRGLGPVTLCS